MPDMQRKALGLQMAEQAGAIIMDWYDKKNAVTMKAVKDFVLTADLESEKYVMQTIRMYFPEDGILSEEAGNIPGTNGYRWVIDPLDGTSNYKSHIDYFSVSIGLEKEGKMEMAFLFDPIRRLMYFAERGNGATVNNKPLKVSDTVELNTYLVSYYASNHKEDYMIERGAQYYENISRACKGSRSMGSSILDLCNLAHGVFDGLVKVGVNHWDCAAGVLLLEEAGGTATDEHGQPISADSTILVASNGKNHEAFLTAVTVDA